MNVPHETAAAARRWLRWANEDLALAFHAARNEELAPRGACMWSHQAGEKAMKALLVACDIDPPKLHDLNRLAGRLPLMAREALVGIDIDSLSRSAIDGRYPDDFEEATRSEATEAIKLAEQVLSIATRCLDDLLGA